MVGAKGEDLILDLPPGTSVREVLPDQEEADRLNRFNSRLGTRIRKVDPIDGPAAAHHLKSQILQTCFDLDKPSEPPRIVCNGGRGGKGNISVGRNNHECERGSPGEERVFELDLKTLADIGLVGLPNAGKSSFLAAVSNAHPKIAPYPFTTLNPYVGTIQYQDDYSSITVADIPGLIEGAHRNIGLGHQFLKHVVKSRALAFVVDFSRPDPLTDFNVLCHELEKFKTGLALRCRLVIANKIDVLGDRTEAVVEEVRRALPEYIRVIPISAMHRIGIAEATRAMKRIVNDPDESVLNLT
jgi:GTP-binding protein